MAVKSFTLTVDGNDYFLTVGDRTGNALSEEVVLIPTTTSTNTLTNKRTTPRITSLSNPRATPTINTDNCDVVEITGQTAAITSMTTNLSGTPTVSQKLIISITGTASRAITWGSSFESSGNATLPTTTSGTARLDVGFLWNGATSKWRCVGVA